MTTPADSFREKAPRLSEGTLVEVLRQDVLAPPVRDAVEEIWLHGSFADPDGGLDGDDPETAGGPDGLSDVDVFVVLDGWEATAINTRFTSSQRGLLLRLAAQDELAIHTDAEPAGRLHRPAVPDAVREQGLLPTAALETTLRRAERTVFFARDRDRERLEFRALDLTLGGSTALDRLLVNEPLLRLWPGAGD